MSGSGPIRGRTQEQELLQTELAVEDVALGQAELLLQVPGGEHLAVQDRILEAWRVLLDRVAHRVAEGLALLRPALRAALKVIGAYWTKHDMTCLPGGATLGSTVEGNTMLM